MGGKTRREENRREENPRREETGGRMTGQEETRREGNPTEEKTAGVQVMGLDGTWACWTDAFTTGTSAGASGAIHCLRSKAAST